MKNRNVSLSIFLVIVVLLVFIFRRWREPVAREAINRHPQHLVYTRHARCRMDCRHISQQEVEEILDKGSINFNKSNKGAAPCPTFAVQGHTATGHNLRIILAQCSGETKIITCYNLEEEATCHCPGDEAKN